MQSLVEFLLQEIAAGEAVARGLIADGHEWAAQDFSGPTRDEEYAALNIGAAHVLAVCAAHRSIVEAHPHRDCSEYERTWGSHTFGCATCHEFDGIVTASGYCPTLRALATAYADRPGWQEAWR